ncbi:hypothetical protein BT96DRAFT_1019488 [Gymnopus androsaceus JB14]|uniref:Uncharacterized protein n=1 Tax=Gymnopus androsaceus JB14 TaxID=1447944 RepID=A0A6A4HN85_9AGAR|nr:hypothetical protein BT96DRAFT_1019488 [Gymnopus androsaceus JB14]
MSSSSSWRYSYVQDTSLPSHDTLIGDGYDVEKKLEGSFEELQDTKDPLSSAAQALHPRAGNKAKRPGLIIGVCFLGATLVALGNHVIFSRLNGTPTGDHTHQFWVSALKNVLPHVVILMLAVALKSSLSQMALYHIRARSYPLGLVNLLTSSPSALNTLHILFKSSMRLAILGFVVLAGISQGIAVTLMLIPGTLTVTDAPSLTKPIQIPTIDFNDVSPLSSSILGNSLVDGSGKEDFMITFVKSSQHWTQLATRAASSNVAPTWDAPAGCASACNYSFVYSAPALNCSELSKQYIWPNRTSDAQSLLQYGVYNASGTFLYSFYYNSSFAIAAETGNPNISLPTLEVYYLEGYNNTWPNNISNPADLPDHPRGVHCDFLNATYEATTSFVNNTQTSTTQVREFTGSLLLPGLDGWSLVPFYTNSTPPLYQSKQNITFAFRSIVDAFATIMVGGLAMVPLTGSSIDATTTQSLSTPLFNESSFALGALTDANPDIVETFSLSTIFQGNLSYGMQELFGNITLAFVNEQMAFTNVNATVTPGTLQYTYTPWKLWLIYGPVFGLSLIVAAYGLYCLHANGIPAAFDMEDIIEMTAVSSGIQTAALRPRFNMTPVKVRVFDGHSTRFVLDES